MTHFRPRYSNISDVVAVSDGFIILEDYKSSVGEVPYLYKINLEGNMVWEKISDPSFSFLNLYLRDGKILVNNGTGEADINPATGELKNWILTR